MTKKHLYSIVTLILLIISTFATVKMCSNDDENKVPKEVNASNDTIINNDYKEDVFTTNNSENGTVINVGGDFYNNENKQNNKVELTEYKIVGSIVLLNHLKKKDIISINQKSDLKFEIKHSGSLNLFDKETNTYNYTGGHLIIYYNNSICTNLKELKINTLKPNNKVKLLEDIVNEIESLINDNLNFVSSKIISCL